MNTKIKAALITGVTSIIVGLFAYKIGAHNEIEAVQSQIANITGNENNVVINDVNELVKEYNTLLDKNANLENQVNQYLTDYQKVITEKDGLEKSLTDSPVIDMQDIGLFIDGEDKNINKKSSYAIINGTEYFSKEIVEKLLDKNMTLNVKDDNLYIGRFVSDSTSLFSCRIIDGNDYDLLDSATDSYGNNHTNTLKLNHYTKITYNLNKQYSLLRFKVAVDEESEGNKNCIISVTADGKPVQTTPNLDKVLTEEMPYNDLPINNCTRLEITCTGDSYIYPLIYDAVVYN